MAENIFWYQKRRFRPGEWNGLGGWTHSAQYFDVENMGRVATMMDIAELLRRHGIRFTATREKKFTRLMISAKDYQRMPDSLRWKIAEINAKGGA